MGAKTGEGGSGKRDGDTATRSARATTADGDGGVGAAVETARSEPPVISSQKHGPSLGAPIAMGYIETQFAEPGTKVATRGRRGDEPAAIARLPFVPHRYLRTTR